MTPAYERYDEEVAAFWDDVVSSRVGKFVYPLLHPVRTSRGLAAIRKLPVRDVVLDDSAGGQAIATALRRRGITRRDLARLGAAVLEIPANPADYLTGRRQQTVRARLRKAEAAGLRCRSVEEPERLALLDRAREEERAHPDPAYRVADPNLNDLMNHAVWRLCEYDGEPVLLAVLAVSRQWSALQYFRTLGHGEIHTLARWLGTYDAVETLAAVGVRHLLDPDLPGGVPVGVRHFQRLVGFRFVRLRPSRSSPAAREPSEADVARG